MWENFWQEVGMRYFFNLRMYRKWRRHATCQQIVVKRGNLKFLIEIENFRF